jgi:hypothetical protein
MNPLSLLRKPVEIDEVAQREAAARGAAAERLARDEAFSLALEQVEAVYMNAWKNADPFDIDVRERAWISVKLLGDLKGQILATVHNGVAARKLIEKALRH